MRHSELTQIAFNWLRGSQKCSLVTSELSTHSTEQADAIGWNGGWSTLVEAKVSLSDLRADAKKPWRNGDRAGMGLYRYFIVPPELEVDALAHLPGGWGLLVPRGGRVRVVRESRTFKANTRRELRLLLSVIRRIAGSRTPLAGVGVRCYEHDAAPRDPVAALSVAPDAAG